MLKWRIKTKELEKFSSEFSLLIYKYIINRKKRDFKFRDDRNVVLIYCKYNANKKWLFLFEKKKEKKIH